MRDGLDAFSRRGVTEQLPLEDQYNFSRRYLLARLAVMLGGRALEEIVIGDITTGAENDLLQATERQNLGRSDLPFQEF